MDSPVTKTVLTALGPGTTSEVNLGFNIIALAYFP